MTSLGQDLARLFDRELSHLADEIAAYRSDADLWSTAGSQKNPPGTLAIHVAGGLEHFIGAALGGSGYVRDRDAEFTEHGLSRTAVVERVQACRARIVPILEDLDDHVLDRPFPVPVPQDLREAPARRFLLHLLWHLGWHLGHVYYHRLGLEKAGKC